jgi:hypothetical protein
VVAGGGDPGRPSIIEAAAGWLVLLGLITLLGTAAYLILWYFHIV